MTETDILILCHHKDANKIPFVIKSISDYLKPYNNIGNIHIVSDTPELIKADAVIYDEQSVLSKSQFPYRSSWIYQQLIKLLQTVTTNNYLSVDADVIFNKPLRLYQDNKPFFFFGRDQYHAPYFDFMRKLGIYKVYPHSFINEIMIFQRDKINAMLNDFSMSRDSFVEFCRKETSQNCHISEFELYGNYIMTQYKGIYGTKQLNAPVLGKGCEWITEEIEKTIAEMSKKDVDLFTMHTWT